MYSLLLKRFCRSRMVITGLLIVLSAGVASVFIGKAHVEKQQASLARAADLQKEHIERNVQFFNKDMGLLFYYLRFGLANEAHPLSALSIGQRDVNSSLQNVNIRNLEAQQYDTDLFNPYALLAGNLDFSFVLIYLFPLLIISFTYNLLSEEKDGGTWRLVLSQYSRPSQLLWTKMLVRIAVVLLALIVTLAFAVPVLSLPLDSSLLSVTGISVLYLLFWFAVSYFIVSLKRNSGASAVMLLTTWLLLTVVLPGAANNYLSSRYEVPEALSTMVRQRQSLHEKWDMAEQPTVEKFFAHYPQLRKYSLSEKKYGWLWYYAAQQIGDDESASESMQMRKKLWKRENASRQLAYYIPTLHTQFQVNNIARTGLSNHLLFLGATADFHEALRLQFYPAIFASTPVDKHDLEKLKIASFKQQVSISWTETLLPLLIIVAVLLFAGWFNLRRTLKWDN